MYNSDDLVCSVSFKTGFDFDLVKLRKTYPSLFLVQMSTEVKVKTKSSHNKTSNHDLDHEKSVMLERICQLQKTHARKSEKIDFLEEHNHTLVEEITKKNK